MLNPEGTVCFSQVATVPIGGRSLSPRDTARASATNSASNRPAHLLTSLGWSVMDPILRLVLLIALVVWTILNIILIVQIDF